MVKERQCSLCGMDEAITGENLLPIRQPSGYALLCDICVRQVIIAAAKDGGAEVMV